MLRGRREKLEKERGGILPLLAILSLSLVGLTAIAIDVGFIANSTCQFKRFSDAAALEMIRAYMDNNLAPADTRFYGAIGSAQDLSDRNIRLSLTEKQFDQTRSSYARFVDSGTASASDTVGTVTPGIWHFVHSTLSMALPDCYAPGHTGDETYFRPCFQELAVADVTNTTNPTIPQAFRVAVYSAADNPIKTFLARVFGQDSFTARAESIVSVIPRRGVFAVDATMSTTSESHDLATSPASFQLNGVSCPGSITATNIISQQRAAWNSMPASGLPSGSHQQSNYQCFVENYVNDGNAPYTRVYAVDGVIAPQPLTNILRSVNSAMLAFQSRSVGGDRFGLIAFDNELIRSRASLNIAGNDIATIEPRTTNAEFAQFLKATAPFDSSGNVIAANFPSFISRMMFPRYYSDATINVPPFGVFQLPAYTNLPLSLSRSLQIILNTPGAGLADNFVMVFTDGFSNCTNTSCGSRSSDLQGSLDYTINNILPSYAHEKVAVHFVLVGRDSKPHNRLFGKSAAGTCSASSEDCCLSETDYRKRKQSGVSLASWVNPEPLPTGSPSPAAPTTSSWPNSWYNVAEQSNGYWTAVRPPCSQFKVATRTDNQVRDALRSTCDLVGANALVTPSAVGGAVQTILNTNFGANAGQVMDASGRLLCDRENRSVEQQLQQLIQNQIMGVNPYILAQ